MFRIFPQKSYPSLWTDISFKDRTNERKKRKDRQTMHVPENYGAVVLAIGAMQIPNCVAIVQVLRARKKYKIKYPNLYAPEVGSLRRVWWSDALSAAMRVFSSRTLARDEARARPLFLSLFGSRFLSLSPSLLSLTFTLTRTYSQFSNSQTRDMRTRKNSTASNAHTKTYWKSHLPLR